MARPDARTAIAGCVSLLRLVPRAPKSGNTRRETNTRCKRPLYPTYSDRTRRLKLAPEILMEERGTDLGVRELEMTQLLTGN